MSKYLPTNVTSDYEIKVQQAKSFLGFSPTADVVAVVRCKDCKHYGGVIYSGICRKYSGSETKVCTNKDHYCSYGERKEE